MSVHVIAGITFQAILLCKNSANLLTNQIAEFDHTGGKKKTKKQTSCPCQFKSLLFVSCVSGGQPNKEPCGSEINAKQGARLEMRGFFSFM